MNYIFICKCNLRVNASLFWYLVSKVVNTIETTSLLLVKNGNRFFVLL